MSRKSSDNTITKSIGNVFSDLGFDDAQAQVLGLRADLMAQLEPQIKARKMNQVAASQLLGVSQRRVCDLAGGKVENSAWTCWCSLRPDWTSRRRSNWRAEPACAR